MTPAGGDAPAALSDKAQRVMVIGASGAGKTTLARAIAERLGLPFLPTDPVYWTAEWCPVKRSSIDAWVEALIARPTWVIDGNFDAQYARLWPVADAIVWLDLPRSTTVSRVARRNLRSWLTRSTPFGVTAMPLRTALGGIAHAARSHREKRRLYLDRLRKCATRKVTVLQSRPAVHRWLASMPTCQAPAP